MRVNRADAYARASGVDELVREHAELVRRIAFHLKGRLPDSVHVDDLIQAGMLGLLEAARKYEAGRGAAFATFAGIRIRGAMVDEIRRGDWAPRSVRRNTRRISEAISAVEARLGREANDAEVAVELGVDADEYHQMLRDVAGCQLMSLDELRADGDAFDEPELGDDAPFAGVSEANRRQQLVEAIASLGEREQLVLNLYYVEELNLKEIGAVLGVSESRVSQIRTAATLRLKSRMADWLEQSERNGETRS